MTTPHNLEGLGFSSHSCDWVDEAGCLSVVVVVVVGFAVVAVVLVVVVVESE